MRSSFPRKPKTREMEMSKHRDLRHSLPVLAAVIAGIVVGIFLTVLVMVLPLDAKFHAVYEPPLLVKFIGRFHPLVLHLPIGLLAFVALLESVTLVWKREDTDFAISAGLWTSLLGTMAAVATGWMLALEGGHSINLLRPHLQFAIAVTVGTEVALVLHSLAAALKSEVVRNGYRLMLCATLVALGVGAHFGGSITHGEAWLTEYLPVFSTASHPSPADSTLSNPAAAEQTPRIVQTSPYTSGPGRTGKPADTTEAISLARELLAHGQPTEALKVLTELPETEQRLPEVKALVDELKPPAK
jgi:hypothetical protein